MPKSKIRKANREPVNPPTEKKSRGRSKGKQNASSDPQRSSPIRNITHKASNASTSKWKTTKFHGPTTSFTQLRVHGRGKGKRVSRNCPKEIQDLRGCPSPTTTVTAENFKRMDHVLQSNLRGVLQDLNTALGQASTLADPNFPVASKQPHGRGTRATYHNSNLFFKTLIPKDKLPEEDEHIKIQFEGTNAVRTDAPGYTETITFGNGRWERSRNGVVETGTLDHEASVHIVEQMKQISDALMHHAASTLVGILIPGNVPAKHTSTVSPPVRGLLDGLAAPRTSGVGIPEKHRGRGRSRRRRIQSLSNTVLTGVDQDSPDRVEMSGVLLRDRIDGSLDSSSTSGVPDGPVSMKTDISDPSRKKTRIKAADMF